MDDRTGDPRDVHSGDATPRGQALDPSRAQDGAFHVTDFSKKIAQGVSIARLPGGSVLLGVSSSGPFQWRGGGSRVGEDCRLRGVAPAATRSCNGTAGPSAQDARVIAVETLRTGERSRTFASAVASMEQIEMSDWPIRGPRTALWLMRFIQTYGSGPLSRHTKWRSETHPPAGQRSSGRARDDFGDARAGERFRPAGRSQPEQLRMLVQAVPGDRGDVEAQRARGTDRGNGTLHGQASSQRGVWR